MVCQCYYMLCDSKTNNVRLRPRIREPIEAEYAGSWHHIQSQDGQDQTSVLLLADCEITMCTVQLQVERRYLSGGSRCSAFLFICK